MWVAWRTGLPGTWCPGVHANCVHNEIAALTKRSLAPLPCGPDPVLSSGVCEMYASLRHLARRYRGSQWSYLETAFSYSGAMRRRYVEAERSLSVDGPLGPLDWRLSAFLKAEKLGAAKDQKPRMIFPRSPRFNLVVASWLKPFEHWLWGFLTAKRLFGGSNTRVVGKGLGPVRRGNLIKRKFDSFADCVVFEVDGKAFEAHVTENHLVHERRIYKAAYPGCAGLAEVLEHQRFAGVTQNGVKFSRRGGRASGDFNTGMGNTLIMLAVTCGVLSRYQIKYDVLVDGDNALVFLERGASTAVIGSFYQNVLESSGFEMTLEKPVSYMEGIRFGRSAPLFLGPTRGWTMVREPESVLSGAYASHRWLREPSFGRRWVNGVARCELSLARGVPVLQAAALHVLLSTETAKKVPVEALSDWFVIGAWLAGAGDVIDVSREARASFERAFGISKEEQLVWERKLRSVAPGPVPGCVQHRPPSSWQLAEPGLYEAYIDAHI
ncbi:RNA-dependent RNA polymerase [Verticillium longisporum ambiguivirus 1]|nr:RNA-dependent RNA polymerase [Verticillium longisporum ambiguivirus 1]